MTRLKQSVKWWLFLSSYIPLFAILIIKHWNIKFIFPNTDIAGIQSLSGLKIPILSVGWVVLAVISCIMLILVIDVRRSKGGEDFKNVESYRSRDELITSYILVYIFPFVVLDYTSIVNWVAFLIFFFVIGLIQVRSSHLYVNPILALLGYRIYEVDTGERTVTLVTKEGLGDSVESVKTVELSNDVHMTV